MGSPGWRLCAPRLYLRALVIALGLAPVLAGETLASQSRRPNIVVIVVDDLGYGDLGLHGLKEIATPNLDSIGREGVRFAAGYVAAPVCSPSRAGILTGRYPQRFGLYDNPPTGSRDPRHGLPRSETTLAERLKGLGYRTALFGKWHLGAAAQLRPNARGFDETLTFLNSGGHAYLAIADRPNTLWRNDRYVIERDYVTFAFAREAVGFIHRHRAVPFLLTIPFSAIHGPFQAPPRYLDRLAAIPDPKRRVTLAMLAALDDAVGRILLALREDGLERDTLLFLIGDNGGDPARSTSRNGPFAGVKGELLEGGIRVPFLARWPGRLPAGLTYPQPVSSLDIHATALAAAGFEGSPARPLDGVDLLPFVTGARTGAPHQALYWSYNGQQAVRRGRHKLLRRPGGEWLFDLAVDPGERRNLALARPELAASLRGSLDRWAARLAPQVQ